MQARGLIGIIINWKDRDQSEKYFYSEVLSNILPADRF